MKYSKLVKERIPSSYKFIRNIFKERSSGDETTERTIDLYYSDERYYLYYEYWVFSSQFAAGSIPLNRLYLEISEEDSKASDEEMIQLVNSILYPDPAKSNKEEYIDDITYIKDMRHSTVGPFHQYDVLLYAQPYGWAYMVDAADYLLRADLKDITEVKTGDYGTGGYDITDSYHEHGDKIKDTPQLKLEQGFLSVAGTSAVIGVPVKVVWVNQTRAMRIFTLKDDELLIKKYVETVIRRSFGTQDAMKLGKSPDEQGSKPDQPKQHAYTYTYKYTFNQHFFLYI